MTSPHQWNPYSAQFHSQAHQFEDERMQRYQISALQQDGFNDFDNKENIVFQHKRF